MRKLLLLGLIGSPAFSQVLEDEQVPPPETAVKAPETFEVPQVVPEVPQALKSDPEPFKQEPVLVESPAEAAYREGFEMGLKGEKYEPK